MRNGLRIELAVCCVAAVVVCASGCPGRTQQKLDYWEHPEAKQILEESHEGMEHFDERPVRARRR